MALCGDVLAGQGRQGGENRANRGSLGSGVPKIGASGRCRMPLLRSSGGSGSPPFGLASGQQRALESRPSLPSLSRHDSPIRISRSFRSRARSQDLRCRSPEGGEPLRCVPGTGATSLSVIVCGRPIARLLSFSEPLCSRRARLGGRHSESRPRVGGGFQVAREVAAHVQGDDTPGLQVRASRPSTRRQRVGVHPSPDSLDHRRPAPLSRLWGCPSGNGRPGHAESRLRGLDRLSWPQKDT